jgi:hypothetical protein
LILPNESKHSLISLIYWFIMSKNRGKTTLNSWFTFISHRETRKECSPRRNQPNTWWMCSNFFKKKKTERNLCTNVSSFLLDQHPTKVAHVSTQRKILQSKVTTFYFLLTHISTHIFFWEETKREENFWLKNTKKNFRYDREFSFCVDILLSCHPK